MMEATSTLPISLGKDRQAEKRDYIFFTLILLALAVDLLTPYLIWKEVIPEAIRWISHAAIAAMMILVYLRMMAFDTFPGVLWLILGISIISGTVAVLNGQGPIATIWGWWIMFQYPFVGLFAYLQPSWPKHFPKLLRNFFVGVLVIQIVIQLIQYLLGETPGDNLAGLFGEHGTANLVVFILLGICFALGVWITEGKWRLLLGLILMGGISSLLGEIKMYPFAAIGLSALAVFFIVLKGKQVGRLVPYSVLILLAIATFIFAYNIIVPAAERRPLQSFLEYETLDQYFGFASRRYIDGRYYYSNVGRNYALQYVWEEITGETKTFLLGMGLGVRGESQTLGTAGLGLSSGEFSFVKGTSLLVFMQEFALLGLLFIGGFFLWVVLRLFNGIHTNSDSTMTGLRYGLLLFTILWPIWLWYGKVWIYRVPMLIYWVVLGYVLSHMDGGDKPLTSDALEKPGI